MAAQTVTWDALVAEHDKTARAMPDLFREAWRSSCRNELASLERPLLVIKYGPPASGKGSIPQLLQTQVSSYVDIDVDSYTAQAVGALYGSSARAGAAAPSQEQYWEARRKYGDPLSDAVLAEAMIRKVNIMWETTGNTVDWTLSVYIPLAVMRGYRVMLAMPIVALPELVRRCKARAQAANCATEYLSSIKANSAKNFARLFPTLDDVLVFDNNGARPRTMFSWSRDEGVKVCAVVDAQDEAVKSMLALLASMCSMHTALTVPAPSSSPSPAQVELDGGSIATRTRQRTRQWQRMRSSATASPRRGMAERHSSRARR